MEENYNTIPLPDFAFAEVINRISKKFCDYHLRGPLYRVQGLSDKVQQQLWDLNSDEDRIQFLGYVINWVVVKIAEHEKECHKPECRVGPEGQEFLYYLYGKLDESGLKIKGDTFTSQEIVENNTTIAEINFKLDELKVGEHILYDDIQVITDHIESMKTDIAELKNLYVLGKKKWYQQVYGIIFENLANKGFDEVIRQLGPLLTKLGHETIKLYLESAK